jgi:hypothetical protein
VISSRKRERAKTRKGGEEMTPARNRALFRGFVLSAFRGKNEARGARGRIPAVGGRFFAALGMTCPANGYPFHHENTKGRKREKEEMTPARNRALFRGFVLSAFRGKNEAGGARGRIRALGGRFFAALGMTGLPGFLATHLPYRVLTFVLGGAKLRERWWFL